MTPVSWQVNTALVYFYVYAYKYFVHVALVQPLKCHTVIDRETMLLRSFLFLSRCFPLILMNTVICWKRSSLLRVGSESLRLIKAIYERIWSNFKNAPQETRSSIENWKTDVSCNKVLLKSSIKGKANAFFSKLLNLFTNKCKYNLVSQTLFFNQFFFFQRIKRAHLDALRGHCSIIQP